MKQDKNKNEANDIDSIDLRLYAKIDFGYSSSYILPYKQGIELMSKFDGALEYNNSTYKCPKIQPIKNSPSLSLLTREQYEEYRMNALIEPEDE